MKWPLDWMWSALPSRLGEIRVAASPHGIGAIWFPDQRHLPDLAALQAWQVDDTHPLLREAKQQLNTFDLPLDLSTGTAFQQAVWTLLTDIPAGASLSYAEVAKRVERPKAVRAVGGAVGHNPISIVVPCHRILGADGSLTGYSGGLERKIQLLQLEGWLL
jgi:methylated-DNA-[protein]-cysteine S-methyltransferase